MHVLLMGYSRFARKRIIAALAASGEVSRLDIASRSAADLARAEQTIPGEIYDSYQSALEMSHADIIYISLINSQHAVWADRALASGRHVIIDKPAFITCSDAHRLTERAQMNNLLLAEANVFSFHPQVKMAIDEFITNGTVPTRITALFSFPPLAENDFRYQQGCGGGALNDLGPYAISAGTVFFNEHPREIFCRINNRRVSGVETAFSVTAAYSEGRSMVGHFGFDTEYQNTISVLGPALCLQFDRVFSMPADYANTLYMRRHDRINRIPVPPADCCLNFFKHIFAACQTKQFDELYEHLVRHAKSLAMLKRAAEKG